MSLGGEERWAPFPVQDWASMPPDEAVWAQPDPGLRVPPAPHRRWWVPLVVLLCLGLVVGTGSWLARRTTAPRTAALAYVPADGTAAWERVDVTREALTQTRTQVTESARFVGITGLLSGDAFLVTRVLHQDYDGDPSHARLWRTDTTWVDGVGIGSQTVRYYRVRGNVELAGEQSPDGVSAYEPALVELPADVGPGSTWSGSGSAGDTLDYTSTFRASAGRDGCLDVTGELDLRAKGTGQVGRRTTLARTWCPGRGLVASSESAGDVRTVTTAVAAPAPGPRTTTSEPIRWSDPAAWTPRSWDTVDVDEAGKTLAVNGSAELAVHPVLTASGLVVRAMTAPDDLVATTPKTTNAWTPVWRVHPGGRVLSLTAFGAVVLVTTSDRALVAYSDAGVRLWRTSLPEIGATPPVRVSDTDAVLVDLSGRVLRLGIADGAVRWTQSIGSDVDRAPAVGAGLVVVADGGGNVTALDATTGASRWERSLATTNLAVVGDRVLAVEDQDVNGLDPQTGRTVFLRHFDGQLTALTGFGGWSLVVCKSGTTVLDAGGAVTAHLPGYLAVDVTASHLVGWATDRLDVVDAHGAVVASWPARSISLISSERAGLPTPQGVYLFADTKGWTFDAWTSGG